MRETQTGQSSESRKCAPENGEYVIPRTDPNCVNGMCGMCEIRGSIPLVVADRVVFFVARFINKICLENCQSPGEIAGRRQHPCVRPRRAPEASPKPD